MANKKVRHIKNVGSVYFDNTKQVWVGQVENGKYPNGRTKYKRFLNSSQEEVVYKMREFKKKTHLVDEDTAVEQIPFSDFFESFLKNVKKTQLKVSSYTRNKCTWVNNIKPYLGGYNLSELTPMIIQTQLITKLVNHPYSYSTIHKTYVLLNECLKYATKQDIISVNPCDKVEIPKRSKSETKDIRFFNDDEIERFVLSALDNSWKRTDFNNGLVLVSMIYTGLRAGEMVALKWENVNFEDNYIKVKANIAIVYDDEDGRQVIEQDSTKTRKSRIVHLTQSASKYLKELYNLRKPKPKDYLFLTNGKRDISSLTSLYHNTCTHAEIDNPQGLHTLRHTFASLMIRKGVDVKLVSEMLGHASVSFTYNTYVHLIEEEKAKVIQQLDI